MAQASSNPFSVQIQTLAALTSFQLTSAVGGQNLPFTLGHAFKQGDVPAGTNVIASIPTLQVSGMNWWPDGSLKFAVIAGNATLTAGVAQTITLGLGAASTGTNLTTSGLSATGVTATVGAGTLGSVSWSGAAWNTPFRNWVVGPQMSSWIYRQPIGSDPSLVAWLEVRLYAGGAVEVLPWIENGYLNVPGPTDKNAVYTFTLGSVQSFNAAIDLPNHCRTVLMSGTAFSQWLGTDPQITPTHNKAYLQASKLVPGYLAAVPSSAAVWSTLAQTYTPLQQGNYSLAMGQTGYQSPIGLIPEWDVLYLASNDLRAYAGVIINAYSAGRYGIHYRDETTQQPLRFSSYPNLVVGGGASGISNTGASSTNYYTPSSTGTVPATWDLAHHPSVGFMAYLLTGRFYFMEQVQFAATINFLINTDITRQFSNGVFLSNAGANITRGAAWAIRTLAQAACVTPDAELPLHAEFAASMEANVDFYYGTYVAQANNSNGIVAPYYNYTTGSGYYSEASWMQDFFTAATGYAIDLQPAMSVTGTSNLAAFFVWKAQSIIGRLGGTALSNYLFCDAAPYILAVAPTETPDFTGGTGPWYANWGQIYAATNGTPNPGVVAGLRGGNFPDATSYWGNLQPAISYAVEHNVPGALSAYTQMVNASNWSDILVGWNAAPVWGVAPRNLQST